MHVDNAEVVGGAFAIVFFILMALFFLIIIGGLYVLTSIVYSKVFVKAGKDKKLAWIPFYREYVLLEAAELNWYWILIIYAPVILSILTSWIPFIGVFTTMICAVLAKIGSVNLYYNINKKFRCEDVYLLLYILLPALIPLGMMGFSDKYKYYAEQEVNPDGFLGDLGFINNKKSTTNTSNVEPEVIKEEEVKVTKEEVKETKKEEVKEAKEIEEKPKKKTNKKKTTKKDE